MSTAEEQRQGLINEHIALVWLLKEGYQVFRNVLCRGDVDLIATKDNEIIQIDVKTLKISDRNNDWTFSWKSYLSEEQLTKKIRILFVKDGIVGWNRDYFPSYKKENK